MTDGCDEFVFQTLHMLALTDIDDDAEHQQTTAGLDRVKADFDWKLATIFAACEQITTRADGPAFRFGREMLAMAAVLCPQPLRYQNVDRLPDQFITRIAELALDLRVDHHELTLVIDHHHAARTGLDGKSEHLLREALLGDVRAYGGHRLVQYFERFALSTGRLWQRGSNGAQQGEANELRGIPGAELSHDFRAVAFEGPVTDVHQRGAFLVGIALADQAQDLALASSQRLQRRLAQVADRTARGLVSRFTFGIACFRPPGNGVARLGDRRLLPKRRLEGVAHAMDQRAELLGFLDGAFNDSLDPLGINIRAGKAMAVLLDVSDIENEGS
ncbi:MAG: hypothetical protein WCB02_17820 [Bradyrhizobium sp.]